MLGFLKQSPNKLAFCIRHDGIAMAMANDGMKLTRCEHIVLKTESLNDIQFALQEFVERYELVGYQCDWVLYPGQYQLITTDNIEVPENEVAQAIKWRIKGLIEYPIDDVTIDACVIPPHGMSGQRKKVFVVAAQTSWLLKVLQCFERSYLKVNKIVNADIAIRNLILTYDTGEAPYVCLYLDASVCKIIIYFAGDFYLIRQLVLDYANMESSHQIYQNIILELQRSFDYCVSQLKLKSPIKLLVTPKVKFYKALMSQLKDEMSVPIEPIDLNDFAESKLTLDNQVNSFLVAGSVLHSDLETREYHAAN